MNQSNNDKVLAMMREIINMKTEDYIFFCIKLRQYCPAEQRAKVELIIQTTLAIRKQLRKIYLLL